MQRKRFTEEQIAFALWQEKCGLVRLVGFPSPANGNPLLAFSRHRGALDSHSVRHSHTTRSVNTRNKLTLMAYPLL